MGSQNDSCHAMQRLTIEGRETKITIITLGNHRKRRQRQSDHAIEHVTNLTN